jgi:hypothetical protein
MDVHAELENWVAVTLGKNRFPYLLLDSAQQEEANLWLERRKVPYLSLFEGHAEENLIEIAPLLVPLYNLETQLLTKICEWAISLGYKSPCLSWIASEIEVESLAKHLRNFHHVGLTENQSMLMRWYDTRVLPVWVACLNPAQMLSFSGSMYSINFINRFGVAIELLEVEMPSAVPSELALGDPLIQLDDSQFSLLMNASDLDTLLTHIKKVIPDETRKVLPRELYEFVGRFQLIALQAGLDDIDRQTQYVLLALYTSGRGVVHSLVLEIMKNPPLKLDDFYAALDGLSDEVWKSGIPLWDMGG